MMMGNHDLVGREAQQEGHEDHPVQAQQAGEGVEEAGAPVEDAVAPHLHVGAQPDQQACRGGHRRRPAQDKEGAVQYRAHHHLPDTGPPVGGQLQGEGGGHAAEKGA